jgi:hypothetical protein
MAQKNTKKENILSDTLGEKEDFPKKYNSNIEERIYTLWEDN